MSKKSLLSKTQREKIMKCIEKRRDVLRTQVRSVAQGYTTALFVHGPGGLGKTHAITQELDAICGRAWCHHTAYSTPRALIGSLAEARDSVHLYEDCEKMYKTDVAASLLRAACGGARGQDRWVTYETANENIRIKFTGGIIIVSNEDISRKRGPLSAVASRFRPVKWDLTIEERIAVILDLADAGWERGGRSLDASHCRKVAEFLIEEMTNGLTATTVDLRTYVEHCLPAYSMWMDDNSGSNWRDVIRSKLTGDVAHEEKREDRTRKLEDLAWTFAVSKEFMTNGQRIEAWKKATGLNQAMYYRHKKNADKRHSTPGESV